jgi:hypothetical protein
LGERNNLAQLPASNGFVESFSKAFQKWRNPIPQDPPEKNNLAQLSCLKMACGPFLKLSRNGETLFPRIPRQLASEFFK